MTAEAALSVKADGSDSFVWGFVSQGFSSATNFALMLMAGRVLGPGGLGVVAVGFTSYLLVLSFQRALVTDPLITRSAALPDAEKARATRDALTVALIGLVGTTVLATAAAKAIGGEVGRGLILVAPWFLFLMIQDFWRSVLFRDRRGGAAATNDGAWLLAMAVSAPLAWRIGSEWAVVGCWALGALVGTTLGFEQTRMRPLRSRRVLFRWRTELWPLGRWLAVTNLGYWVFSYATLVLLLSIVGAGGFGGMQAVGTVFAPLTLIGSALSLVGLPALSRRVAVSRTGAAKLAFRIGLASALAASVYLGVVSLGGGSIIPRLFGHSFAHFTDLIWPTAVSQILGALALGFGLLLKAQRRGSAVLLSTMIWSVSSLALVAALGISHGLLGAAWGFAAASAISLVANTTLALRVPPAARVTTQPAETAIARTDELNRRTVGVR
jgi:O-antigen/teichoic acid export membrane protein